MRNLRNLVSVLLVVSLVLLSACGSSGAPKASSGSPAAPSAGQASASSQASGEKVVWKFGSEATQVDGRHPSVDILGFVAKEIEKSTNGKYTAEVFQSGQLGTEREVMESAVTGVLPFGGVANTHVTTVNPLLGVYEFPFLFRSYDHFWNVVDSDITTELLATTETSGAGLKTLDMGMSGIYSVSNNRNPVVKMADMKGLKIRTPGSPLPVGAINALGALATPITWTETYTGLQQGLIDGVLTMPYGFYSGKIYEQNKYVSQINMFYIPFTFFTNPGYWNGIPAEDQALIIQGLANAMEVNKSDLLDSENAAYEAIAARGMEVIPFEDLNLEEYVAACQPLYDEYQDQYGEWFDRIRAIAG